MEEIEGSGGGVIRNWKHFRQPPYILRETNGVFMNRALIPICVVLMLTLFACSKSQEQKPTVEWMDTNEIHSQPNGVSKLSDEQLVRVKRIHDSLSEADPSSLDKWISDFEKDQDPESEIRVWEAIAAAYQCYCSEHRLDPVAKQDVLRILLLRSETDDEAEVLKRAELKSLAPLEAHEVLRCFKGKAVPIEVEEK